MTRVRLRGPPLSIPVAARSARQLVLETPAGHGLPLVLQLDAVVGELDGHDVLQHQARPRLGPLLGSRDAVDTLVLTREDERDRGAVATTQTIFGRAAMAAAYKPRWIFRRSRRVGWIVAAEGRRAKHSPTLSAIYREIRSEIEDVGTDQSATRRQSNHRFARMDRTHLSGPARLREGR